MTAEKREQVAKQCEAVAHMATALARVNADYAKMFRYNSGKVDGLVEQVGQRTANLMNVLGDILNGMDAVDEKEDAWIDPVFEEARRLWPVRIQRKRTRGWKMPPNTVSVTRPGKWGNPFTYSNSGDVDPMFRFACEVAPLLDVTALRGKNLACFCAIGRPCHADVLLALANPPRQGEQ